VICSGYINRVELQLSGIIGTSSYPNTQKIGIIGFFFENRLYWKSEYSGSYYLQYEPARLNISNMPEFKFKKPQNYTALDQITGNLKAS